MALLLLGVFAAGYSLYGGLKAVALTDIIQVVLLVLGGLLIAWILLNKVSDGAGVVTGFGLLMEEPRKIRHDSQCRQPALHEPARAFGSDRWHVGHERFLLGFQSVHYSACAGGKEHQTKHKKASLRRISETLDAGYRRVAGHRCFCSRRRNQRPDQAYPHAMTLLPVGIKGLVFAALLAAIVSSLASMTNSISTIFTMDIFPPLTTERHQPILFELVGSSRWQPCSLHDDGTPAVG